MAVVRTVTTPTKHTFLNQSASQSTSLYQQCSALRSRLMHLRGFSPYFSVPFPDSTRSTDPVTQLWDLFSIGIPLCYIFDQLPAGFNKINNSSFDNDQYLANPDRVMKRAIALFAMQIKEEKVAKEIRGCEPITVTDLWDRNSTDGLVKVINTVTAIVDYLPPDVFDDEPPTIPKNSSFDSVGGTLASTPTGAQESTRDHIIKETVETERKYVQALEIMQKYAAALAQDNLMDQDTICLLFPGLNKLVNFQRKFLITLERVAELPSAEQRWGLPFIESEDEFVVYEPYCSNYARATEIMRYNVQNLSLLNHMINVKGELPGLLIKPIQRICTYPLLLDSLINACSASTYAYYEELKKGTDAARRVTGKIGEAQRRAENEQIVKSLQVRVVDWKGHHLGSFGDLLLDDVFIVRRSEIDQEYHVFLFEKIMILCRTAVAQSSKGAKGRKQKTSLLNKQVVDRDSPLLLKGRIFLNNFEQVIPVPERDSSTHYPLAIWWNGIGGLDFFILRCRRDDQMRQWEVSINRLIKEATLRRARMVITVNTPSQGQLYDASHGFSVGRSDPVGITGSNVGSENNCGPTEACPLFSVQSFEPQVNGLSSDIIVTVGVPPEYPTETLFTADSWRPPTPRSIWTHSSRSAISFMPDDFSDTVSEYWSCSVSKRSSRRIGHQGLSVIDGELDRLSEISQETFETALEPPPDLYMALRQHLDPILHPPPLSPLTSDPHGNPITKVDSPVYNISFIRDVSNVCITGSHINFTTNIVHHDDNVRVGLHTLYLKSDPTALYNSHERQKWVNQQTKAIRAWGSQLLITSSSTLGKYPLSVPSITTRDLEEVVQDVFTWLYSSSPHSIMWLHEFEGNLRTSLIGQCLAGFLGERRDLTASYFYTKRCPSSAATSPSRTDDPCSIIPTIAYELTRRVPEIKVPIASTAANDLWIFDLSLEEQMEKLIVGPLQAAPTGHLNNIPRLFLIHGLEDCNDDDFQELFLRAFGKSLLLLQKSPIPQKLLLLGRHTTPLQTCFLEPEMQEMVRQCPLPMSQDSAV